MAMTGEEPAMSGQDPALAEQRYYEGMSAERRRIIGPLVVLVCAVYFALPLITNFTDWLDGTAFEGVSWAYVYVFGIYVMVLVLTTVYRRRMDATEHRLRPPGAVEIAADYEHWDDEDGRDGTTGGDRR